MNFRKTFYLAGLFLAFNLFISCDNEPETYVNVDEASFLYTANQEVDVPVGFRVSKMLAPHAPFPDDLSVQFRLKFEDGGRTNVRNLNDASTMVVAEVQWDQEGSTSGWHMHPGIALVSMTEGEIEVVWENECIPRIYRAGDAFLDPGKIHKATSINGGAKAIATFLGIPNGQPATIWVAPRDCD
ncbi:MAG: hypothetical protein ABJ092_06095 [Gillisia sp.]